jgi:hypothetical protein
MEFIDDLIAPTPDLNAPFITNCKQAVKGAFQVSKRAVQFLQTVKKPPGIPGGLLKSYLMALLLFPVNRQR